MGTYQIPTKSNPNQSVKPKQVVSEGANVISQEVLDTVNIMFCYAALTDQQKGTLCTDATGALSAISLDWHQYFVVVYDYDINCIFAEPIANMTDAPIVDVFDNVFTGLTTGRIQAGVKCNRQTSNGLSQGVHGTP